MAQRREYDNLLKYLAERYPAPLASWLLGKPVTEVRLLKSELSLQPIRADAVHLLEFDQELVHRIFRREIMMQSVIYREIWEEGEQIGEQRGMQIGEQHGRVAVIQRQLTRRFGSLPIEMAAQLPTLSLAELDQLGDALLDFKSLNDLTLWLAQH